MIARFLAEAAAPASEAAQTASELEPGMALVIAIACLLAALGLLIMEFFLISGGILGIMATAAAVAAVGFAFIAGPAAGYSMLALVPICGLVITRWGIKRIQKSSWVPQSTIADDAGYHHHAEKMGVAVDAEGTMVTDAYPSGRCHFAGGELDVQMVAGSAEKGQRVRVKRIDGPIVYVSALPPSPTESPSP